MRSGVAHETFVVEAVGCSVTISEETRAINITVRESCECSCVLTTARFRLDSTPASSSGCILSSRTGVDGLGLFGGGDDEWISREDSFRFQEGNEIAEH